jgi:MoaA/NifB/PqqE/SkfB family radical SAM enzyme
MRGWYFTRSEIDAARSGELLLNASLDLSNPCNLNCPYCYVEEKNSDRKRRKPHELTLNETLDIIADFSRSGTRTVNLVGAGEPTIDSHFMEVLNAIYNADMTTVLFTNGIVIAHDDRLVEQLYARDVTVVLKVNSRDPEVQDVVAGRSGYTQKRDLALQSLLNAGFTFELPTRLGFDIMAFQGNYEEIPEIHEYCRENNIFPISSGYIPTGRTERGLFMGIDSMRTMTAHLQQKAVNLLQPLSAEQKVALKAKLREIDLKHNIDHPEICSYYGGGICSQLLGLYVDIEGNIWPCVARSQILGEALVATPLGNTRKGDIPSTIWANHPYLRWIRDNYNGGCPYKERGS